MTRLEALRDLKAKVEAGEYDVRAFRAVWPFSEGHDDIGSHALYAMKDNSLDAARAMHEAVLPGWWWKIGTCCLSDDACVSPEGPESVTADGREWSDITDVDIRPPENPARAWLLAVLVALIEQEEQQ
jgi:hypothetical protein